MKKALFKPNSKIGENFELAKFQEMLLKKIHYFYKTYIRHVKKINGVTDNSRVYELIKIDVDEYNEKKEKEKWALNATNLGDKQYDDMDLKNLMIVEFFRELGGRNPFLKMTMQGDKMDMYLNQEDEYKAGAKADNDINAQANNESNEDYLTFNEISLQEKVEILFFFCNYALTFSGRANFFRDELVAAVKEKEPVKEDQMNMPSTNTLNTPIKELSTIKTNKRIQPLGKDSEGNTYYHLPCNKDCRIYLEKEDKTIDLVIKNYEDLEKFMAKLDTSLPLAKNIKDNLITYKGNDEEESKKETNVLRKQQAFEKAKKLNSRQGAEIEKYSNSDYFLMNISDHVITRSQLNQITKINQYTAPTQSQKPQVLTEEEKKRQKIEKEKIERQKRLEKRNRIFEKRLEQNQRKRRKETDEAYEEKTSKLLKRKRKNEGMSRKKRGRFDSSEEEYISSSEHSDFESVNNNINAEFASDASNEHAHEGKEEGDDTGKADNSSTDIIIEGNLIYRHTINQVELDGFWFIAQETPIKERLSYLFQKSNEYMECYCKSSEVEKDSSDESNSNDYRLKVCSANLFECILINQQSIFDTVLKFLTGEYAGYFIYYGKTIEDRVNLHLTLEDSLVRITGEGTNSLGNFSVIGYMNFYRSKETLIEKNDASSEIIKLADFKLTKIYTAFNPNENYRVIKSYQHRRKKVDDDYNF